MRYNWAGDVITRDTIVEGKRCVVGYDDRLVPADIREWLKPLPNCMISSTLSELPDLPRGKEPGSFDDRAWMIWDFVTQYITYIYDKKAHDLPDFWMVPEELLRIKQGDCEDSTFLLASLLLASGISPFCVRAVLGIVRDKNGEVLGGHAWPIYLDEGGKWRLLESTLKAMPHRMPLADSLTKKGLTFQYEPMLCFNQYHLWTLGPLPPGTPIERYMEVSKGKVNVAKSYESGLDVKY